MFNSPSMFLRIVYGKIIGFIFAGAGILIFSEWYADISTAQKWGFVLYYTVVGALIGLTGIMTYNPVVKLRLAWWFRGPWLGAWMNFILLLFIYDDLSALQTKMFGAASMFSSPWWFVVEGAVLGFVMDFICTKFAGEGMKTVLDGSLEQP